MDAMKRVFGDYPGRPDHPDFWRMAEVVMRLDGASQEEGKGLPESCEGNIDLESLMHHAEQRVGIFLQALGLDERLMPKELVGIMQTIFATSVITGIEFQKAGGHRA